MMQKQICKLIVKLTITTGLLVWVFSRIDLRQFADSIKSAHWRFLIAVWFIAILSYCIQSVKMRLILKKQQCDVNITTLLNASFITSLYAMIMPTLLSTSVKWYILKQNTGKGTNVFSAMVYNQLTEIFIMLSFALIALMITNPAAILLPDIKSRWVLPLLCGVSLTAIMLFSLLLLNPRTAKKISKTLTYLLKPFHEKTRCKVLQVFDQVAHFRRAEFRFHLVITLLTIAAGLIGTVVMYILSARAANVNVPVRVFFWLAAIIDLFGRIPISIANLGVREVTLLAFLAPYGAEPSAVVLMSMILFSAAVFVAAIGAFCQLSWAINTRKFRTSAQMKHQRSINH